MKIFRKLIRDNIPQIMEAEGKKLNVRVLSEEEFKAVSLVPLEPE